MNFIRKITIMAILGAIGAVVGAMMGEALFPAGEPQRTEPRHICLLFDTSGSMTDRIRTDRGRRASMTQLEALKEAACDFVDRQELAADPMGLAVFASDAHVITPMTGDGEAIKRSIRSLTANGGTNLGRGFDVAAAALGDRSGERWILVFTDGKPESSSTRESPEAAALSAAARAREAGVQIVAIGTGLADATLLAQATGSLENVVISDPDRLADAFQRSEEVIDSRQMLASEALATTSFWINCLLTGAWATLIAIGAGVGLVTGQNLHLRRRPVGPREAAMIVAGGVLTGLAAGAAGQTVFYMLSSVSAVVAIGRVVAWSMLGCGIGYGMGYFVPNLAKERAGAGGAAGGAVAAFCFLTLVPLVGDTVGRLLAAAILGLSTGMMLVLVETAYRAAWLIVHWSPKESSTLTLGDAPILVGRTSEAHVLLAEDDSPAPIMARIRLADGCVQIEDDAGRTRSLGNGETLEYGRIRIEVRAGAAVAAAPDPVRSKTPDQARTKTPDRVSRARDREAKSTGGKWYDAA